MSNYCPKCGSRTYQDSLFCEMCGSQLTSSKTISRNVDRYQPENKQVGEFSRRTSAPRYSSATTHRYRRKSHNRLGFIVGIIVIGVIGFSFLSMFFSGFIPILNFSNPYQYVGSHDYMITNTNYTHLHVIIDNSIGSVNVFYVDSTPTTLDAQIHVYTRNNKELYESDVADIGDNNANHLYFQFTPYSDSSWNDEFKYDIDLYISDNLESNLQIDVSTGSIMIDARDVVIGEVFLETSTGSIEAYFQDVIINNSEYNYFHLETSTGSVNTRFHNVYYISMTNNPQWGISTSTGSVDFDLTQEGTLNTSLNVIYDVSVSTGSITCNFELNETIGYYLDASTSLGDIILDGLSSEVSFPYTSENYLMASLTYNLIFSTSTGSIQISKKP